MSVESTCKEAVSRVSLFCDIDAHSALWSSLVQHGKKPGDFGSLECLIRYGTLKRQHSYHLLAPSIIIRKAASY